MQEHSNRPACNPDEEDCSEFIGLEYKSYGISNLGWSGMFKTIAPDVVAALMLWVFISNNEIKEFVYKENYWHKYEKKSNKVESSRSTGIKLRADKYGYGYDNDKDSWEADGWVVYKCGYRCQINLWIDENGFSDHMFAWFAIGATMGFLYTIQNWLWVLWSWFGWLPRWLKFWIEHVVSNFNWAAYGYGFYVLIAAAINDETWTAWMGFILYAWLASSFYYGEWRLGTDAIRWIDFGIGKDYYIDPYLYPSILYLVGFLKHEEKPEFEVIENDPSAD